VCEYAAVESWLKNKKRAAFVLLLLSLPLANHQNLVHNLRRCALSGRRKKGRSYDIKRITENHLTKRSKEFSCSFVALFAYEAGKFENGVKATAMWVLRLAFCKRRSSIKINTN